MAKDVPSSRLVRLAQQLEHVERAIDSCQQSTRPALTFSGMSDGCLTESPLKFTAEAKEGTETFFDDVAKALINYRAALSRQIQYTIRGIEKE